MATTLMKTTVGRHTFRSTVRIPVGILRFKIGRNLPRVAEVVAVVAGIIGSKRMIRAKGKIKEREKERAKARMASR